MFHLITLFLILLSKSTPVYSNPARLRNFARHEHTPNATEIVPGIFQRLHKRQVTSIVSTCGYYNGDLKSSRTADVGFGCRVDTSNGLWGFCPTTVLTATDCGLAGYCVDRHSCRGGCGRLSNRKDITTVNCGSQDFCSTVLLINGPDQSFEYIACGQRFAVDSLLAVPNPVEATTTVQSEFTAQTVASRETRPNTSSASTPILALTSSTFISTTVGSISSSTITVLTTSPVIASESTFAESKSINVGAIVGGAIAGIVVICATILGVFFIGRRRGHEGHVVSAAPPSYIQSNFGSVIELTGHTGLEDRSKPSQWNGNYGPVELIVKDSGNMSPVELPGTIVGQSLRTS